MSNESQTNYLPESIIKEIDRVSQKKSLTEKKKEKLTEVVAEKYRNKRFEPGEAVGIIAAQSISEPATQMTMRTYHFAGSAGVQITLGLPRLIEVFDARKTPTTPMMTLYLNKEFNTKEKSEKIANVIKERRMGYFIDTISIDITNRKIKILLKKTNKKELEEIIERLSKSFKKYKIKESKGKIDIQPEKDEDETSIKDLEKLKKKVLSMHVTGIPDVKSTLVVKKRNDWVIKTLGSNFDKAISMDEVDATRSYTNNIYEMAEVLGIEAARNTLISEINETIHQQGLNIDERHISLVADIMTLTGEIRAVGRYGVAGMKSSVLTRAGFEETIKHLVKASIRNEVDNFKGIFDNVMINQQVPVGTGMFDLIARLGSK